MIEAGRPSRRDFLGWFGSAVSASALLTRTCDALLAEIRANSNHADEEFWAFIRKQSMLEPQLIYLNAGTTGAMPRPVFEAEVAYQRMLAKNPKSASDL